MAAIGKVSAVFTASTAGLRSGVNQAASAFRSLESSARSTASGMRALVAIQGAQLFGSIASSAAGYVRSLVQVGAAQAEVIDGQSKLAARLGMTYGELSGLALAGELAGVGMDAIGAAATRADVAFVRAAEGSQTALAAFQGLGLSIADLNGMSSAERFNAIADAIAALPTEAQRAEAAVQLFGRAGAQLLPLFSQGAGAIAEARAQAEAFGLALTNAQGQDVEAMNDSFTLVGQAINGIVQQVTASLAPAITAIATEFTNFVGSIGGANIGQAIGDGILEGARFLAGIGDYIIQNVPRVFEFLSRVGVQWSVVWDFAGRVASLLFAAGRFMQGAFLTVVGAFSAIGQMIVTAARNAAGALGFDTSGMDVAVAAMDGFNKQISKDIASAFNAAGENFTAAFAEAPAAGEALAGPLTTSLDAAIARAREVRNDVDVAARQPIEVNQNVTIDGIRQAVNGIDSRSAEGVKEMFRLMRGEGGNIPQQQLQAQLRIAAAVEAQADDGGLDVVEADIAM